MIYFNLWLIKLTRLVKKYFFKIKKNNTNILKFNLNISFKTWLFLRISKTIKNKNASLNNIVLFNKYKKDLKKQNLKNKLINKNYLINK